MIHDENENGNDDNGDGDGDGDGNGVVGDYGDPRKAYAAGNRGRKRALAAAMHSNSNYYSNDGNDDDEHEHEHEGEVYEDAPVNQGLLSRKRKTVHRYYKHGGKAIDPHEWMRPYWLGAGLFLILFAFWLLDSLKDPIFVKLVDGKISQHQPPAKLCSVVVTLVLVCALEFLTNLRQQRKRQALLEKEKEVTPSEEVLDPGGIWKRIQMKSAALSSSSSSSSSILSLSARHNHHDEDENENEAAATTAPEQAMDDIVSFDVFYCIGVPYIVAFSILSYFIWRFEQKQKIIMTTTDTNILSRIDIDIDIDEVEDEGEEKDENPLGYYVLGYILYATVESFGSLAVATFWSYTNSTLSLHDAERYYGPIIATAQLGAIGGSTLVAAGRWESSYLLIVVALSIVLQLLLMRGYDRRFKPTSILVVEQQSSAFNKSKNYSNSDIIDDDDDVDDTRSVLTLQDDNATLTKPFWSGLYLIFRHSYVLMILGVSCLYEVAMTLLDYQMKLLGFAKFNNDVTGTATGVGIDVATTKTATSNMSFSEFMGHYGQVVNVTSLVFSSLLFPFLIRRLGLRRTLLWFPTLLLVVTFLAYGALPGNLTVLFVSLSLLKAMTYSVHDPSKELLYIPTSNAIKFRAKFWIDVVGERISKAIGSAFNTLAKNVEQSVKIGGVPSLLSALGLWLVCYYVGLRFDKLLATGKIVGLEHSIDPSTYTRVARGEGDDDDNDNDNDITYDDYHHHNRNYDYHYNDHHRDEPSEVEIGMFEEDNVSTLDLMADPVRDALEGTNNNNNNNNRTSASLSSRTRTREDTAIRGIELPPLSRI